MLHYHIMLRAQAQCGIFGLHDWWSPDPRIKEMCNGISLHAKLLFNSGRGWISVLIRFQSSKLKSDWLGLVICLIATEKSPNHCNIGVCLNLIGLATMGIKHVARLIFFIQGLKLPLSGTRNCKSFVILEINLFIHITKKFSYKLCHCWLCFPFLSIIQASLVIQDIVVIQRQNNAAPNPIF